MKPEELLGVIIRTIGLVTSIACVQSIIHGIAAQRGAFFTEALVYGIVGLAFLLGASSLAKWCYSIDPGDEGGGPSLE